ncbi:hypothetical protein [Chitinophaga sp.]|uniref:hypothetical protein n=1 Tax=Chitinophaga sp. TaxID=1869181 RepID=UPI0031D187C0
MLARNPPGTFNSSPASSASTTLPMLPRLLPFLLRSLQRPLHCRCFPGYFQLFSDLFSVHHIANASPGTSNSSPASSASTTLPMLPGYFHFFSNLFSIPEKQPTASPYTF